MKKKNVKGFLLIETLVVTTFVAGVLIFLFIQFSKLNNSYTDNYKYNTPDDLYALQDVLEYINSDDSALTNIKNNINTNGYINLRDCSVFTDTNYCNSLLNNLNIEEIIISSRVVENLTEIDPDIYIKATNRLKTTTNYFLVAKFSDNSYAALDTTLDFREEIEIRYEGFYENYNTTIKQGKTIRNVFNPAPTSITIKDLNSPTEYVEGEDYTYDKTNGKLVFKRVPNSLLISADGYPYCDDYMKDHELDSLDLNKCLVVANYAQYNTYNSEFTYENEALNYVNNNEITIPILYTEPNLTYSEKKPYEEIGKIKGTYTKNLDIFPVTVYNKDNENDGIPSFNSATGMYTLVGNIEYKDLEEIKKDIESGKVVYSTLLSENNSNRIIYKILGVTESDPTKGLYYVNRAIIYTYDINDNYSSNPGLYKVADDYSENSYIYRGELKNNWVKLGDFLFRIIRINGDGSIRIIYQGLASAKNHIENNSIIENNSFADSTYNKPSGYTYVGYMYNPNKIKETHYNAEPSETLKLDKFLTLTGIPRRAPIYLFNSFNMETDCVLGDEGQDNGTCTLTCTKNSNGTLNGCVNENWYDYWKSNNLYNSSDPSSTDRYYKYTGEYKYTCLNQGTLVEDDNKITYTCSIVKEIVGVDSEYPVRAKIKLHGLFSNVENESDKYYYASNIKDSSIKKIVENWYDSNIKNTNIESYLSDEIFCNDRSYTTSSEAGEIALNSFDRIYKNVSISVSPTLKCTIDNDKFMVSNSQAKLKYPVGLITADEATFAGTRTGYVNEKNYLNSGISYWTLTPSIAGGITSHAFFISNKGGLTYAGVQNKEGIRPVINLKSNVLFSNGSGTEDDPYEVSLGGN